VNASVVGDGNRGAARLYGGVRNLFCHEHWFIAYADFDGLPENLCQPEWHVIVPRDDRFYADPFLFEGNGSDWLFFEDYRYATGKGVISCIELDDNIKHSDATVVLETDYHLSYPFLFEWDSQVFMLPEAGENKTVELYRAEEFPYRWKLESVLMSDVRAGDPTLLQHDGIFWLFLTLDHGGEEINRELWLFSATSPLGPWKSHPRNPIVNDLSSARPAGPLFIQGGELIRPSQDCSIRYGHRVKLNRVEVLNEREYRETTIATFGPDWLPGNLGTHHLSRSGRFIAIDGRRWKLRSSLPVLRRRHIAKAG